MEDVAVTLTRVAMQTQGITNVDYGDSFTYEAEIDLPAIQDAEKADLAIEVFALEPDSGGENGIDHGKFV